MKGVLHCCPVFGNEALQEGLPATLSLKILEGTVEGSPAQCDAIRGSMCLSNAGCYLSCPVVYRRPPSTPEVFVMTDPTPEWPAPEGISKHEMCFRRLHILGKSRCLFHPTDA
jgi:hypothetical protein